MTTAIPEQVSVFRNKRATGLETLYAAAGLRVEIEAGPIGLVVYGASRSTVEAVAKQLLVTVRLADVRGSIDGPATIEADEPPATCWNVVVTFDWAKFEGQVV